MKEGPLLRSLHVSNSLKDRQLLITFRFVKQAIPLGKGSRFDHHISFIEVTNSLEDAVQITRFPLGK